MKQCKVCKQKDPFSPTTPSTTPPGVYASKCHTATRCFLKHTSDCITPLVRTRLLLKPSRVFRVCLSLHACLQPQRSAPPLPQVIRVTHPQPLVDHLLGRLHSSPSVFTGLHCLSNLSILRTPLIIVSLVRSPFTFECPRLPPW